MQQPSKFVQLPLNIFFMCAAASENILFFKERAAASEIILRKNVPLLLKENVQLFLRIMSANVLK